MGVMAYTNEWTANAWQLSESSSKPIDRQNSMAFQVMPGHAVRDPPLSVITVRVPVLYDRHPFTCAKIECFCFLPIATSSCSTHFKTQPSYMFCPFIEAERQEAGIMKQKVCVFSQNLINCKSLNCY